MNCPDGGIGRRARFRSVCRKVWRFESSSGHQKLKVARESGLFFCVQNKRNKPAHCPVKLSVTTTDEARTQPNCGCDLNSFATIKSDEAPKTIAAKLLACVKVSGQLIKSSPLRHSLYKRMTQHDRFFTIRSC